MSTCIVCNGRGMTPEGLTAPPRKCDNCDGRGYLPALASFAGVSTAEAELDTLRRENEELKTQRAFESICRESNRRAVKGVCPVHGGDACLVYVPQFAKEFEANTRLRWELERQRNTLRALVEEAIIYIECREPDEAWLAKARALPPAGPSETEAALARYQDLTLVWPRPAEHPPAGPAREEAKP